MPQRYGFSDLTLDDGRRRVSRGSQHVKLPALSFRLLAALVEASPNLLTADELIDRVWEGRVVSPETVTQRVKLLRAALDDDAREPKYIESVRGGGYRLIPDVHELEPETASVGAGLFGELRRRRVVQAALVYAAVAWTLTEALAFLLEALPGFPDWSQVVVAIAFIVGFPITMFLAWRFDLGPDGVSRTESYTGRERATVAAAVALLIGSTAGLSYLLVQNLETTEPGAVPLAPLPDDVVALLPFRQSGQDPELAQLSSGLNDLLRDNLRGAGLRMVARRSSHAFDSENLLPTDIAARLKAGTVIEGEVSRVGAEIRLRLSVIEGTSGVERLYRTFREELDNLGAIEKAVVTEVASVLLPDASPRADSAAPRDASVYDNSVYNKMLLARHFEQEMLDQRVVDPEVVQKAVDLYRQILLEVPDYAMAHSRLGGALLYVNDVSGARPHIFKALELNPELADVQYNLGLYHWAQGDASAGDAFRRALALDPNHVGALEAFAKWIWFEPDYTAVLEYFERTIELDPMSLSHYADLGSLRGWRNESEEVDRIVDEISRRFRSYSAYEVIARLLELTGDLDQAIAWAWRSRMIAPRDVPDPTWQLSELYSRLGMQETAAKLGDDTSISYLFWAREYRQLADLAEELIILNPDESKIYYHLGFAYNALDDFASAVRILKLAGLPDSMVGGGVRRSDAYEALPPLIDALVHTGNQAEARSLAEHFTRHLEAGFETGGNSWWGRVYGACAKVTLGQIDSALADLEYASGVAGIPWNPVIRDSVCFRKLAEEPRYQQVIQTLEDRKVVLRERLPRVLEEFAVHEFAEAFLESR